MTATGAPTGTPLEVRDPSACFRLRELLVWLPLGALLWFPAAGLLLGWHRLAMREDGLVLAAAWFYLTVLAWMLATLRRERLSLLDLLGHLEGIIGVTPEREHTEREPHRCQSYLPAAMDAW